MTQLTLDQIIKNPEFITFYKAAEDYCNFIENYNEPDFLIAAHKHLFGLYNTGKALPQVELISNIEYEELLDGDNFNRIMHFISDRLDTARYYWHVFYPVGTDDKVVAGDLLDDLGDIYKDLAYDLMIFNLNKKDCRENAIFSFKSNFEAHWSRHCINAIYAIHYFLERKL